MKVLQFKNKKLCERLEQRQAMEDELREKIEKLEKRQATDDTTLLIVNRYWSQVSPAHCNNINPNFQMKHDLRGFIRNIKVIIYCIIYCHVL